MSPWSVYSEAAHGVRRKNRNENRYENDTLPSNPGCAPGPGRFVHGGHGTEPRRMPLWARTWLWPHADSRSSGGTSPGHATAARGTPGQTRGRHHHRRGGGLVDAHGAARRPWPGQRSSWPGGRERPRPRHGERATETPGFKGWHRAAIGGRHLPAGKSATPGWARQSVIVWPWPAMPRGDGWPARRAAPRPDRPGRSMGICRWAPARAQRNLKPRLPSESPGC